jgi:DNA-directed RNA polymerase subunit RPC12/RpoP
MRACRYSLAALIHEMQLDLSELPSLLQNEFDVETNRRIFATSKSANSKSAVKISARSCVSVRWRCSRCSSAWTSRIADRVHHPFLFSCPDCAKALKTLAQYPIIAADWDIPRNADPHNAVPFCSPLATPVWTEERVFWQCSVCSSSWQESVVSRVHRYEECGCSKCPHCHQRDHFSPTADSLVRDAPLLRLECKQDRLQTRLGSPEDIDWKCVRCSYCFRASARARAFSYLRCPQCSGKVSSMFNQLEVQRPDVCREIAASTRRRSELPTFTIQSDAKVRFICRVCLSDYRMSIRERCLTPPGLPACPKCVTAKTNVLSNGLSSGSQDERHRRVPLNRETLEIAAFNAKYHDRDLRD